MTEQIKEIVRVNITRETLAGAQSAFSTVLIAGDSDKLPAADVIVLAFDAAIVTGNTISLKLNEGLITQAFDTDNDTTLAALAAQIQALASVLTAVASGTPNDTITITAVGDETAPIIVTEQVVTGGASQANITNTRTAAVRTKSYASMVEVAVDFATTDPEYKAADMFFAQDPHPSTVKIGRIDSGGDWSDEVTAINNADPDWYFLVITTRTEVDVKDVAAWVDGQIKAMFIASADSDIPDSAISDDIASFMAAQSTAGYDRVAVVFNELADNIYPEVAWVAYMATKTPGSATWNFKTLTGVTPSTTLTDAQRTTVLDTKNANLYTTVGGRSLMREGQMSNGEFIDLVHGTDYLESVMTTAIFDVLAAADKIPYTDAGIAVVEGAIRATLDDFIVSGFIDSRPDLYNGQPYEVSVPKVADVSAANKSNRILPDITFRATLQGAIHEVEVEGTVAV